MEFCQAESLRHYWYPVAEPGDVEPGPLAVTLLGADYVVWRAPGGELVAAPDREQAISQAMSTACAKLSSGVTQGMACMRVQPISTRCEP